MRKFRPAFILAIPLVASLFTACGSSSTPGVAAGCKPVDNIDTSNLNLVLPGNLTVASDITYPPQEFVDSKTHAYVGMDIDIANEIAKRLCLKANVQNVQFNTIITGITSSTPGNQYYDMSISAWTINPDRQKVVDMVPYFTAGESLLVPNGNPHNIKSLNDVCGLAVAAEAGTVEEGELNALNQAGGACASNHVNERSYDTQDQVTEQLLNGSVDATYQDSPVSGYYASLNSGKFQEVDTVQASPEGIVVRKDNNAFESAVKQILSDMRADGTYKTILQKWGQVSGAYPPLS